MSTILASGRESLARGEYTLRLYSRPAAPADEPPVLVVHEGLGSFAGLSRDCGPAIPDAIAARGCRVFGFDLAGHGASDVLVEFPEDFIDRSADDLLAVMDAFDVPRAAAVVGIGTGALVALSAAARAADRIGCVFADSPPGVVPAVVYEPWHDEDVTHADGYDPRPAWLRFVHGLVADPPRIVRPEVPVLIVASVGKGAARVVYEPGWKVAWAPGFSAPVYRGAPEFFVRQLERFLAAHT